jgi:hypothetical protein
MNVGTACSWQKRCEVGKASGLRIVSRWDPRCHQRAALGHSSGQRRIPSTWIVINHFAIYVRPQFSEPNNVLLTVSTNNVIDDSLRNQQTMINQSEQLNNIPKVSKHQRQSNHTHNQKDCAAAAAAGGGGGSDGRQRTPMCASQRGAR